MTAGRPYSVGSRARLNSTRVSYLSGCWASSTLTILFTTMLFNGRCLIELRQGPTERALLRARCQGPWLLPAVLRSSQGLLGALDPISSWRGTNDRIEGMLHALAGDPLGNTTVRQSWRRFCRTVVWTQRVN